MQSHIASEPGEVPHGRSEIRVSPGSRPGSGDLGDRVSQAAQMRVRIASSSSSGATWRTYLSVVARLA